MKNAIIGILLIATMVFGVLYLRQARQTAQAEASAGGLQQKASELQSSLEEQQGRAAQWRDQLAEARVDAAATSHEAAHLRDTLQQSLTNQASSAKANHTNSKASNPLSEMFKNPEMKEMIKNQQKAVLGTMMDKNYGKLFADLHLTPEQTSTLKDMIMNKQLSAAETGMSLFTGESDAAKRTEMVQQVKAASDAADAQIKQFLGDDNFAQLQAYEKTIGERTAVSGFKDQLGSGQNALSDAQAQQLIQAMTQERQNFKFTTDLSDKSKFNGDFASMFTEDKMTGYFQELGQLNQRYLAQAQSILSPDQATAFEKYLNSQQAMQKVGMQMAVKMFAPAKPDGD